MSSGTALRPREVMNTSRKVSPAPTPDGSSGQSAGTVNGPVSSSTAVNSNGPPVAAATPAAMLAWLGARAPVPTAIL